MSRLRKPKRHTVTVEVITRLPLGYTVAQKTQTMVFFPLIMMSLSKSSLVDQT